jgi:hypothetical protein
MASDLIKDEGQETRISGTRLTVYDLLPYFIDPTATEEFIGRVYDLTVEQVAAARASVFANADTVLARHLQIEERLAIGNPPEVIEKARAMHARFVAFRKWLADREAEDRESLASNGDESADPDRIPSFREWLAREAAHPSESQ